MRIRQHLPLLFFIILSGATISATQPGKQTWSLKLDDLIFSSATADPHEPILYVGTVRNQDPENPGGSLYALEFGSGFARILWEFPTLDWVDSSPTISPDGTLYAGSWDGNLYAVNAPTGDKLWEFATDGIIVASPALDSDGNIYFPSTDGFFYALNPDGDLLWEVLIGAEMDSSPAMDLAGNIYLGTLDGELIAINTDGQILWTFTVTAVDGLDSRIISSPAITAGGAIVFGSGNGYFYALNTDGDLLWETQFPEELDSSPVIDRQSQIYFGARSGELYQLDTEGVEHWAAPLGDIFFSSPVIDAEGRIYIASYAGDGESDVTCLAPDGTVLWTNTIPAVVDASPTLTPDGLLVVGAYDGVLYAFHAGSGLNHLAWPQFGRSLTRLQDESQPTTPENINRYFPYPPALAQYWHYSSWLGLLYTGNWPWIYRPNWDWIYPGGPGTKRHWLYHPQLGWLWTGPVLFPHAYEHRTGEWIYIHLSLDEEPWYYRFKDNPEWFRP